MARTPRTRYVRHRDYDRTARQDRLGDFLTERAGTLLGTGASDTFTADSVAASGVLTAAAQPVAGDTVTLGALDTVLVEKVYTLVTALSSPAVPNEVKIDGAFSVGTLTLTGNAVAAETVTIGATVYTFRAALAAANEVLIGSSVDDTINALVAAVNGAAGAGVLYGTGTTANASATAVNGAGDTVVLTAITFGVGGDAVVTTETMTVGAFGGATLASGDSGTASDTIDNLIAAINAGAGAGTLYGTGTIAHPEVTASAGAGDTMDVDADEAGAAFNALATTETGSDLSWGAVTLESGADGDLNAVAHGLAAGDGPFVLTNSGGALPGGLSPSAQAVGVLTLTANSVEDETVTVGTQVYTLKDALTIPAAADEVLIDRDAAVGVLTLTGNAVDAETATIGTQVYTFKTTLSTVPTVADEILIGAAATDSIDNLIAAINGAAGEGTTYSTGTVANVDATAAAGAGDTMDLTAVIPGPAGDAVVTTETMTVGSFGAATLAGGAASGTASDTIDNLIAAINGAAGEGTTYSTGTLPNIAAVGAVGAGDTMGLTAAPGLIGLRGNVVATTETQTNGSFGAAALAGGIQGQLYWVAAVVDVDNFTVTTARGGPVARLTDNGTGTHTITGAEQNDAVFEALRMNPVEVVRDATDFDALQQL